MTILTIEVSSRGQPDKCDVIVEVDWVVLRVPLGRSYSYYPSTFASITSNRTQYDCV